MKSKLSILLLALVALLALSCANPVNPDPPPAGPTAAEQWATITSPAGASELRELIDSARTGSQLGPVAAMITIPDSLKKAAPDIFGTLNLWGTYDGTIYRIWLDSAISTPTPPGLSTILTMCVEWDSGANKYIKNSDGDPGDWFNHVILDGSSVPLGAAFYSTF